MKRIRGSVLLSLGFVLTACLLAGAAAGGHPQKKCYDTDGNEIPCPNSNFSETQFAARATARHSGPTAPAVAATPRPSLTVSPTSSPTVTPTGTTAPAETPVPILNQAQQPATPAASAPRETSPQSSSITLLVLVAVVGLAAVLVVLLLILLYRWLSGRGKVPPGPPN
jgi:hypothetical protein